MGKTGPKKTDKQILENRGSWRSKLKKEVKLPTPQYTLDQWHDLACTLQTQIVWPALTLPNFDPYKTAGDKYHFDSYQAAYAIAFFEYYLVHVQGADGPFHLEPWERALVGHVWGWRDKEGHHRWREIFVFIARGNGKSAIASGLCLLSLLSREHKGAAIVCVACDKIQAAQVFDTASEMLKQSPAFAHMIHVSRELEIFKKAITLDGYDFFRVESSDASSREGGNPSFVCFDEIHAQPTPKLYRVMSKSAKKRRGAMLFSITTAGNDTSDESIGYECYKYAKAVQTGEQDDPTYLPVLYEMSDPNEWKNPDTWDQPNPNMGISVHKDNLIVEYNKIRLAPNGEFDFKCKNLNIWCKAETKALDVLLFDQLPREAPSEEELLTTDCWGGFDGAWSNRDLTSFALYWPKWHFVRVWTWTPIFEIDQREIRDKAQYILWERQKWLTLTEGHRRNDKVIREAMFNIIETYPVKVFGVDRAWITELLKDFVDDRLPMKEYIQGFVQLNAPTREIIELYNLGMLNCEGNPLMRYAFDNCGLARSKDATEVLVKFVHIQDNLRIDPAQAAVTAIGSYLREQRRTSTYAGRGETDGGKEVDDKANIKPQDDEKSTANIQAIRPTSGKFVSTYANRRIT